MTFEMLAENIRTLDTIKLKSAGNFVGTPTLHMLAHMSIGKKRILEIGTSSGQTTINMAKFSAVDSLVYSVDIIQGDKTDIEGYPWFKKIRFIEMDSKLLDFKSLKEKFDLIFIDGEHSLKAVVNDTLKSLEVLAPGGQIVWHDINCPSVLLGIYYTGIQFGLTGGLAVSSGKIGASPALVRSTLLHIKGELESIL